MAHERQTLENVTRAGAQASGANQPDIPGETALKAPSDSFWP